MKMKIYLKNGWILEFYFEDFFIYLRRKRIFIYLVYLNIGNKNVILSLNQTGETSKARKHC
jgi:hypothetical protein